MTIILRSVAEFRTWRKSLAADQSVGFVPTMGALHDGHMSLVALARARAAVTVASIFVNPLQFGPNEDLAKYPRPIEKDIALLEAAGVDALFLPGVTDLYPEGASTFVVEESVSGPLCGSVRPGHFRGVATVVLKLFNIVRGPIVREADGLALSSRNVYLSAELRSAAPLIFKSLKAAEAAFANGERNAARLTAIGRAVLAADRRFDVQYWEARSPHNLEAIEMVGQEGALLAVAAYLGPTRLIDNLVIG
jgi:pantoate--beta-alanine ligase